LKKINWIILFLALGISSSCLKNEICSPSNIELKAGIYTLLETDGIVDTIPLKIDLDSIYGLILEDKNWLINESQIDEINFPLNDASNETGFVLSIGGIKDTIQFAYEKHLLFNSVKCGTSYTYTINNITNSSNFLKNIILINSEINVLSTENIQLVF